ncbi:MAG: fucose isomerase [Oscillospiraceae bacterium]|nr:fucose isomerase [Oscillospiraceae bacterium]
MKNRQTFGIIVTTRSFFPSHLVKTAREEIVRLLNKLGHDYIIVSETDTDLGAVLSLDEAKTTAKLFKNHQDDITGIIVVLPNFGEELGVAETIDRAGLNVPVLIQACGDDFDKLDMANRRDAFCGKISLCNNLRQRKIPFTLTSSHTCALDGAEFEEDVKRFAAVCNVARGLKNSRIAMLGARPAAFNTVRFSEKILQKYGISVQTVDLSEVMEAAKKYDDSAAIEAKEKEIREYGHIPNHISPQKINLQAKLCITMEKFVDELDCRASTVQCWDSLEKNYGCAACLGMSMMGEKGRPSACESDVTGAVSMLAAQLAAYSAPALMDWNNNVQNERDCCVALHCSNFPKSFFESPDLEIGCLDVLGSVLGQERTFGACKAQAAAGPMTFVRVTTDDTRGIMKMYVGEGEFGAEKVPTKGGTAFCRVPKLQELLKYICDNGFEHHVCFVRGHVADILEEAMGRYMGIEVYRHDGKKL